MIIDHPSLYINPNWVKTIRQVSAEAEQTGVLHPDQLALIHQEGWFKLLVPMAYSGLEKSIPELVRLEERISWVNGSVGWVVTLCSGAGWFGGFLSAQMAADIFKKSNVCLAGSGAPTGTAVITPSGYKINGIWKYASGAHHATHFTANCSIKNGTETVNNDDGSPLILPFIFDRKDVSILSAWKYIGMMATGSDAFEIKELEVSHQHCFEIDAKAAVVKDALYQYPFLQLAEATLAVNISGIAIHFMDLCAEIFQEKLKHDKISSTNKEVLTHTLIDQHNRINAARELFYRAVDKSWVDVKENHLTQSKALEEVSTISRILAKVARECVDELYPYCGLVAASTGSEINQVWRDLHTASQHSLLTFL